MRIQTYHDTREWTEGYELEVLRDELKEDAHEKGLLHLSTHLLIIDPKNRILSRHRATTEFRYAGLWTTAIGTHVEAGKDYESTLRDLSPCPMNLDWVGEFRVRDEYENEVNGLHVSKMSIDELPAEFLTDREFLDLQTIDRLINLDRTTPHLAEAIRLLKQKRLI